MTTPNATPDLPAFDPNADRGNELATAAPLQVELTAEELKLIGKEAAAPEKAAEDAKAKADRGDTLETKPADKEPAKTDAKATETVDSKAKTDDKAPDKEPAKDDQPRDKEGKFIPKARFDAVNNRAKARVAELEAEVARLKQAGAPAQGAPDVAALETELDTKSAEYSKLLADGELDKANAVMRDINKINRQIGVIEATALSTAHSTEVQHVATLEELVTIYKDNYPQFDDANKDHYNQGMVDYVARLQGGFELSGYSPAEALREAVEAAVAKFGLDPEPVAAAETTPAKEETTKPAPTKAEERKTAAVDKAIAAAAAQPASLASVGSDSDKVGMSKIDVGALSYEQFEALPESTKSRLRGDNV